MGGGGQKTARRLLSLCLFDKRFLNFHESGEMLKTSVHKNVGKHENQAITDFVI